MKNIRIIPKITYTNFRKDYPNINNDTFKRWFFIESYWYGRIIDIWIKHHKICFDFRKNWLLDMVNYEK